MRTKIQQSKEKESKHNGHIAGGTSENLKFELP